MKKTPDIFVLDESENQLDFTFLSASNDDAIKKIEIEKNCTFVTKSNKIVIENEVHHYTKDFLFFIKNPERETSKTPKPCAN